MLYLGFLTEVESPREGAQTPFSHGTCSMRGCAGGWGLVGALLGEEVQPLQAVLGYSGKHSGLRTRANLRL